MKAPAKLTHVYAVYRSDAPNKILATFAKSFDAAVYATRHTEIDGISHIVVTLEITY